MWKYNFKDYNLINVMSETLTHNSTNSNKALLNYLLLNCRQDISMDVETVWRLVKFSSKKFLLISVNHNSWESFIVCPIGWQFKLFNSFLHGRLVEIEDFIKEFLFLVYINLKAIKFRHSIF